MALLDATSIPRLMRLVESGMLDVSSLVTHCRLNPALNEIINLLTPNAAFPMAEADKAYSTFQAAAEHRALKVTIDIEQ